MIEEIAHKIAGARGIVVTVAPAIDQSGVGHSISYLRPTLLSKVSATRFSVEGSPADCVLAGIHHVIDVDGIVCAPWIGKLHRFIVDEVVDSGGDQSTV